LIYRELENGAGEIIQGIRVGVVDAKIVGSGNQLGVITTEFVVGTGVVIGPTELPTHNTNAHWVEILDTLPTVNTLSPQWESKTQEKDRLYDDHTNFQVTGEMTLHPDVRGIFVVLMPEAEDTVKKEHRPTDKKRNHEPMDDIVEVVNLSAVGGKIFRNA
jgi:hypothetical protein